MNPFEIMHPTTIGQAADLWREHQDDAMYLSGGMTLVPSLKARLAAPEVLINLASVQDMHGIERHRDTLRIGALTRFCEIIRSPVVAEAIPGLASMAGLVADRHVRNRATLGGSLANNDPAADFPAAMLALGATMVTDRRRVAADDFFAGLFETSLEPGEILVSIECPVPDAAVYAKHAHPASGYAVVGVFVARFGTQWRISVTGSGEEGVFRFAAAERTLQNGEADQLGPAVFEDLPLMDDAAFPARFRAAAIDWLLREALTRIGTPDQD